MISKVSYNAYASNVNGMTNSKKINFCSNEEKIAVSFLGTVNKG